MFRFALLSTKLFHCLLVLFIWRETNALIFEIFSKRKTVVWELVVEKVKKIFFGQMFGKNLSVIKKNKCTKNLELIFNEKKVNFASNSNVHDVMKILSNINRWSRCILHWIETKHTQTYTPKTGSTGVALRRTQTYIHRQLHAPNHTVGYTYTCTSSCSIHER